jgi:hypothetical protein
MEIQGPARPWPDLSLYIPVPKTATQEWTKTEDSMIHFPKKRPVSFRTNAKLARALWGGISKSAAGHLRELTERHHLSIAAGDVQLLEGRWYVTHAGLLRLAQRRGCSGINVNIMADFCDSPFFPVGFQSYGI